MKQLVLALLLSTIALRALDQDTLVAHWDFSSGKLTSAGGAFPLTLKANAALKEYHGNRCLHISSSDRKRQSGLQAARVYSELSPADCFRIEISFRLAQPSAIKHSQLVMFDTKNVNYQHNLPAFNRGIMLWLQRLGNTSRFRPGVSLGLGDHSKNLLGSPMELQAGSPHVLTFSFNRGGKAVFALDGKVNATLAAGDLEVKAGVHALSIGDRGTANYMPFVGDLLDVKLFTFPKPEMSLSMAVPGRRAFLRNERDACLKTLLANRGKEPLPIRSVRALCLGNTRTVKTPPQLSPAQTITLDIPVETRLRPDSYPYEIQIDYERAGQPYSKSLKLQLLIGPEKHDCLPVVLWGSPQDFTVPKQIGFTHLLSWGKAHIFVRKRPNPQALVEQSYRLLDQLLAAGLQALDLIHVAYLHEKYPRVGRDGKPYQIARKNFDATNPQGIKENSHVTKQIIKAFKEHPAYAGTGLNSEVRDNSRPSFSPLQCREYKRRFGRDIPPQAEGRCAPHYTRLKGFPLSRILEPDHPLLQYYAWFWKEGDGWNPLHSTMHNICKKIMGRPFKTFYDPAVRVPPLWGSGGNVDLISHWTYAYPNPINIAVSTEETMAMAAGRPGQEIGNMTQIIAYRSQTAPIGASADTAPHWVTEQPKAKYITLAPDLMRIALWTQLSRQVSAIMFHGYGSLVFNPKPSKWESYRCTNLETRTALQDILLNVVRKLGPVLKRLPEQPAQVAVLESFTSSVFAGRGTWGASGWGFNSVLMLLWANMAPKIIYEETILRDGLENLKVLVMPHCDVLTRPVFEAITDFQKRGGLIVADEYLVPGITPDIQIHSVPELKGKPLETKRALATAGLDVRKQLAPYFKPQVKTSTPDLVTHVRRSQDADFLFVVNDRRTYGDYWGPYGLVAEKGLPTTGTITLNRTSGAVYDLVRGKQVNATLGQDSTTIARTYKPAEGTIFLILPKPIGTITLEMPRQAQRGKATTLTAHVLDSTGAPLASLHPLMLEVRDADGKLTDDSTAAAMENGTYTQSIIPPLNAQTGRWKVTIRDVASGKTATRDLQITE